MALDVYGNEIIVDMTSDEAEGIEAWNLVATTCIAHGLGFYIDETGVATKEPHVDEFDRILWRVIAVERQRPLTELTLGDRSGPPRDAADEALSALPLASSKRTRAAALLMLGMQQADIVIKLRISGSTVSQARAALLREYDEKIANGERPAPLPESVTNAGGLARRGQPRPDMRADSPDNPIARFAADMGVSQAEARAIASDRARIARYGERPQDLRTALEAHVYRERKRRERACGDE